MIDLCPCVCWSLELWSCGCGCGWIDGVSIGILTVVFLVVCTFVQDWWAAGADQLSCSVMVSVQLTPRVSNDVTCASMPVSGETTKSTEPPELL